MPSRRKRSRGLPLSASEIANIAKSNPYIQALIDDSKLRKQISTAVASGKNAYGRVANGKAIDARGLLEDRKLHSELGRALGAAREVTITMTKSPRRRARKGLTFGRKLMIVAIGGGLALAGSEKLRSKVLDTLFGAEEEFQYTPPAPPTSAQATTPVSAA
jgi:hypothetical protein